MGEEAAIKAGGDVLAGISSSSSEPKLRNFTCVPESLLKAAYLRHPEAL